MTTGSIQSANTGKGGIPSSTPPSNPVKNQALNAASGNEWNAINVGDNSENQGPNNNKLDGEKLAASMGTSGDTKEALLKQHDVSATDRVKKMGENAPATGVQIAATGVAVAAGVTTGVIMTAALIKVATVGGTLSAALGPFAWVGLIATLVGLAATAIGFVAKQASKSSKAQAAKEQTRLGGQKEVLNKTLTSKSERPNIIAEQLSSSKNGDSASKTLEASEQQMVA